MNAIKKNRHTRKKTWKHFHYIVFRQNLSTRLKNGCNRLNIFSVLIFIIFWFIMMMIIVNQRNPWIMSNQHILKMMMCIVCCVFSDWNWKKKNCHLIYDFIIIIIIDRQRLFIFIFCFIRQNFQIIHTQKKQIKSSSFRYEDIGQGL